MRKFYNHYLSSEKQFARSVANIVGFTPSNLQIFKQAFSHKSASDPKLHTVTSNERLEYLGDSILSTIVAEYLFQKYPNSNEGFLTKMRSKIVKRKTLNRIADDMGIDVVLQDNNDTRLSESMKGNALEALVGAIYLEKGFDKTKDIVVKKILRRHLNIQELEDNDDNYKSQLLEFCQKNGNDIDYRVIERFKMENRDRFKIAVYVNGKEIASGEDFNKKSAEQNASFKALKSLGIEV
ncbi:MAG: ribonuclease III [Saprospiraceae bacterium]|nr:ribonuclease III [Candidatus Opimibacter skivensis]MBL0008494.1 ribonuclease III [Candidatus Opimibacter skivensis]